MAGKPKKLLQTAAWLDEQMQSRARALELLALALVSRPDVTIGSRVSRALSGLLDEIRSVVDEAQRR